MRSKPYTYSFNQDKKAPDARSFISVLKLNAAPAIIMLIEYPPELLGNFLEHGAHALGG